MRGGGRSKSKLNLRRGSVAKKNFVGTELEEVPEIDINAIQNGLNGIKLKLASNL